MASFGRPVLLEIGSIWVKLKNYEKKFINLCKLELPIFTVGQYGLKLRKYGLHCVCFADSDTKSSVIHLFWRHGSKLNILQVSEVMEKRHFYYIKIKGSTLLKFTCSAIFRTNNMPGSCRGPSWLNTKTRLAKNEITNAPGPIRSSDLSLVVQQIQREDPSDFRK